MPFLPFCLAFSFWISYTLQALQSTHMFYRVLIMPPVHLPILECTVLMSSHTLHLFKGIGIFRAHNLIYSFLLNIGCLHISVSLQALDVALFSKLSSCSYPHKIYFKAFWARFERFPNTFFLVLVTCNQFSYDQRIKVNLSHSRKACWKAFFILCPQGSISSISETIDVFLAI